MMGALCFRIFPSAGVVALFEEPNTTGDVHDFNAPRNAPAKFPASHLPVLHFHSETDCMETVFAGTVAVNHPFIDMPAGGGDYGNYVVFSGTTEDHILYEHNLGYPPIALVAVGDNIIWPGMLIHVGGADNFWRYGTVYCDNQYVRLFVKSAALNGQDAAAATVNYTVLVFKEAEASGDKLFEFDPTTSVTKMGLGKFRSDARYLQVVAGGSPLGIAQGRTIDLKNGASRAYRPDGTYKQVAGGSGAKFTITPGDGSLGSAVVYNGTYAGPSSLLVQAP
jgi:hypothetical protein